MKWQSFLLSCLAIMRQIVYFHFVRIFLQFLRIFQKHILKVYLNSFLLMMEVVITHCKYFVLCKMHKRAVAIFKILLFFPRMARISSSVFFSKSCPSRIISPPAITPGGVSTRPIIDREVILFPQPDSPTIPRVFPLSTEKDTSFTALVSPASVRK